ncbi:MAG: DUF3078 domain-containing protein [Prevotella sp.]|nr:DUF3078 domain-containing protein [Prevotella sp.]
MKHSSILLLLGILFLQGVDVSAQRSKPKVTTDTAQIVRNYMDSLRIYRARLDSLSKANEALRKEDADGRFYRLFAPATFYHSPAHKSLSLSSLCCTDEVTDAVDGALMGIYLKRPDLLVNSENRLRAVGTIRNDVDVKQTQNVELAEQVAPAPEETPATPVEEPVMIKKPNFWTFKGDYYLQFLQNYITSNWHKGGESNYSMLASLALEANYNNKQKVKWDNKLEMKLGFQTSRSDTVHTFKTNNDLLRLTSKLGLQAHKKWYYTLQLLAYTQFAPGYKSNDPFTYSDIFSPFDLNIGLGMDYAVETKNKKLTGNINLSPLSYNFRYVSRLGLAERYGLKAGHHTLHDIGSQLTVNLEWKIAEQVTWKTRLYGYTSYKRALVEWENTLELKISKFITTNIYVYPRFDDSGALDSDLGYWQFMEYCSLGFAYNF